MRLNTRPNARPIHRGRSIAGAVVAALVTGCLITGPIVASAAAAGAARAGTNASAPHISDSIDAAASELVSLQTAALRLQRQNAALVAARDANQAETVATKTELATTRTNRRDRAVQTYIKSFTGQSLDDLIRPTVRGQRLEILSNAADRADQNRIKVMEAHIAELAVELRATEASLAENAAAQVTNQEQLDTVKEKLAAGTATIGPSGAVAPAAPGPGPIAKAARAAEDALLASDVATARTAAAVAAAQAAPTDPDVVAVAYAAVTEQSGPKAEHDEKQQHLAEVVGEETGADAASLEATWVATPSPGLRAMYFALSQVGKDYVYATSGPNTYDCSGLTRRAWQENQIALPHFSGSQLHVGTAVATDDLRPGDLLAYGPDGSEHVVLYLGAGWDVEAKGTEWGVVVERADTSSDRYAGASRPIA